MAVIVDDELVADLFGVEPRTRGAERTQADGDVEQPVDARPHRRQRRHDIEMARPSAPACGMVAQPARARSPAKAAEP